MPTLLMCPHRSDLESLIRFHGVPEGSLLDRWGREPEWLSARVPYLLGSDYGHDELDYCRMLEPHGGLLCDMCQDFGSPATVALAELTSDFQRYASTGLAGGGSVADVYRKRVGRFLGASWCPVESWCRIVCARSRRSRVWTCAHERRPGC
jgi:hypothetical protein